LVQDKKIPRRHRWVGWNMKKITAYRRSAGLVMVVMMSAHIFSGLGLLCPTETLRMFRALGIAPSGNARAEIAGSNWDNTVASRGGTSKCCCKKHKKCPAIPRAAITSNPTHRFNEVQFQAKSVCCDSLVPQVTDHRFSARGDRPLMELAWCAPFYCSNPLALTSILLI
jgi:hypothetical protein